MDILIVCVNYNSYDALSDYLNTIYAAQKECDGVNVEVKIADNSTHEQKIENPNGLNIEVFKFNNLGYFGAAQTIINGLQNVEKYKYIIISNVDLLIPEDFFSKLKTQKYDNDVAWIAPKILSLSENKNRNPKIISRLSKKRVSILQLFYRFPFLNKIYETFFYSRRQSAKQDYLSGKIYAGHGSFIILSNVFFANYKTINYPIFMFGEEIYLAELIRAKNLHVFYDTMLTVNDKDHVSTREMKKDFYYKCNYDAITFIKKTYYE